MKKKPDESQIIQAQNRFYRFDLFKTDTFLNIPNARQTYGIILDEKDNILLVAGKHKVWILPGGGVEPGETYKQTLIRESYEEAAVTIKEDTITPAFYQKVFFKEDDKWHLDGIEVRYFCRINKKDTFTQDPDMNDILYQKYVNLEELPNYLLWGNTTTFIQKLAKQYISNV